MKFLTAAVFVMATGPLWAASISYVTADTTSTGMSNLYDSVTGLSQNISNCYAVGTTNVVPCATLSSTPATNTPGLTSASVSIDNGVAFDPQNGVTGFFNSSAYANLAAGAVGVLASGLACSPPTPLCSAEAFATAEMQDSLTFTNSTGSVQDITLSWSFDGSFTSNADAPATPRETFTSLFCFAQGVGCFGNANSLPHGPISLSLFELQDSNGTVTNTAPSTGWVSTSITGGPTAGTFQGVFAVPTGTSLESLNAYLTVECLMATCDFSHTGALSISPLPDGVSFTSDSGVLLTSATPEPRSWLLALSGVGLLLLGSWGRRLA